jgi:hypothetical protein
MTTKRPAMLFYPGDWLKDPAVRRLSLTSRAIWFDLLCFMFEGEERGSITGTPKELARLVGATAGEFRTFLVEAENTRLCDFDEHDCKGPTEPNTPSNRNLTLTNRRMVRDEKAREDNADRQRRYYDRHKPNVDLTADLTEPSQASSSSSSSSKKYIGADAPDVGARERRREKREYSPDFERAMSAYPPRVQGNSKPAAYKAWCARIADGVSHEEMIAGVQRYATYVRGTGAMLVKQASTFFGPDEHWKQPWGVPAIGGYASAPRIASPRLPTLSELRQRDLMVAATAEGN